MATLKISDLSVGDWVYYDKGNTPYSIRSIYRTGRQDCVELNDSVFPDTKRDLRGMNKILKECGSEVLLKEEDYDF